MTAPILEHPGSREMVIARANREREQLFAMEIERVSSLSVEDRELLFSLLTIVLRNQDRGRELPPDRLGKTLDALRTLRSLPPIEYDAFVEVLYKKFCIQCGQARKNEKMCACADYEGDLAV